MNQDLEELLFKYLNNLFCMVFYIIMEINNKTRQSPSTHASETILATIKKGNNGNKWIVIETKNHIHRWLELNGKISQYQIMHNGELKYKAIISDKKILIFGYLYNKIPEINRLILSLGNTTNIFLGKIEYPEYKGKNKYKGNTILIETKKNNYVYLGHKIVSFITKSPIIKYVSDMDPIDTVSYPYALTNDKIYIFLDFVMIDRNEEIDQLLKKHDPYQIYYTMIKQKKPTIKFTINKFNYKNIE